MSDAITALLIGGSQHGAVLTMEKDVTEIEVAHKQQFQLVAPRHIAQERASKIPRDTYKRLTIDKHNRAIYVIKQEGCIINDTFVDYMFSVFMNGGK